MFVSTKSHQVQTTSDHTIFTCAEGTPVEINKQLKEVCGESALSRVRVWKWWKRFDEGRTNIHDEERSDQLSFISKELVDAVKEIIKNDRYVTITDLCKTFIEVSKGTLHEIARNCLGFRQLCARYVPKQLTSDHLEKRMTVFKTFEKF